MSVRSVPACDAGPKTTGQFQPVKAKCRQKGIGIAKVDVEPPLELRLHPAASGEGDAAPRTR